MSAREFRVGELVDVTIRDARVERVHDDGLRLDVGGAGINIPVVLPSASASITTERVAPADWPPITGDLWRDEQSSLWFIQNAESSSGFNLRAVPAFLGADDDTALTPAELLAACGPLVLVHREAGPEVGQ